MSYLKTPLGLGFSTDEALRIATTSRRGVRDHRGSTTTRVLRDARRVIAQPPRGTGQARDHRNRAPAPTLPPRGSGQPRDHRTPNREAPVDQELERRTLPPVVIHPPVEVPPEPPAAGTAPTDQSVLINNLPPVVTHPPQPSLPPSIAITVAPGPTGPTGPTIVDANRLATAAQDARAEFEITAASASAPSKPNLLLYGGLAVAAIGALWYFRRPA